MSPAELPLLPEVVAAIARAQGFAAADVHVLANQGAANDTYGLGADLVLRIARPGHARDLATEAAVLPAVVAAGLPVPALVAHHPGDRSAPAYAIQRRCHGTRLDADDIDEPVRRAGYIELGRVLRHLHDAAVEVPQAASYLLPVDPSPRSAPIDQALQHVDDLTADGWIGRDDARWLGAWLAHLAAWQPPSAAAPDVVLIHGDASGANVLVDPATGDLTTLLDWGDASRADPAVDLAKVPPLHLPQTVAGYAQEGGEEEETWAARALWHHLTWALGRLPTSPRPDDPSWSAPPAARLLGLLELISARPGGSWVDLFHRSR